MGLEVVDIDKHMKFAHIVLIGMAIDQHYSLIVRGFTSNLPIVSCCVI